MNDSPKLARHDRFFQTAIQAAVRGVSARRGGPFGAVVVKDGQVIAEGCNEVTATNDPTAHAEMQAIRAACKVLGTFQLDGCDLYASCEPCPMCLGALYWARPRAIYFAATREDAANAGFDDAHIYDELAKPPSARTIHLERFDLDNALDPFAAWHALANKIPY